jgi:hypothetical protein
VPAVAETPPSHPLTHDRLVQDILPDKECDIWFLFRAFSGNLLKSLVKVRSTLDVRALPLAVSITLNTNVRDCMRLGKPRSTIISLPRKLTAYIQNKDSDQARYKLLSLDGISEDLVPMTY